MTVTVQVTPPGYGLVGVSVIVAVPSPPTVYGTSGPPSGHSMVKEFVSALTASLKLIVIGSFGATPFAPLAGTVVVTAGGESTVKVKTWFAAMLSGGSLESASAI